MQRESCLGCALKHIAQARVLVLEARKGYPEHAVFAIGHMAEASDELVERYPALAEIVRGEQKKIEINLDYIPDFLTLVKIIRMTGEQEAQELLESVRTPAFLQTDMEVTNERTAETQKQGH